MQADLRALNHADFAGWLSIVNGFIGAVAVFDDAEATFSHVRWLLALRQGRLSAAIRWARIAYSMHPL